MGICIEVNGYLVLEGGFQFAFQMGYKLAYPAIVLIVFVTIADEDVVFKSWDQGGHC